MIHEIYDSVIEYSRQEEGLSTLMLTGLPRSYQLKFKFDPDLLNRITEKTQQLQILKLSDMSDVNKEAKSEIIGMIQKLIPENSESLAELYLEKFTYDAEE